MNKTRLQAITQRMVDAVKSYVSRQVDPLRERIAALEARLAKLERRK